MNGLKNQSAPSPEPGVREAAIKLIGDLDQLMGQSQGRFEHWLGSIEALRLALQRDRTAVLMISDPATAAEGIKRMKDGQDINQAHIRAIVEAAEAALANESNGIMRFEADMRAIRRWQEAAPAGEDRSLTWPDHADLVVWLLELVELRPACPSINEVADLIADLRKFPSSKLFTAAADQLEQLANALVASSRRTVHAEAINTQLVEQMRRDRLEPGNVVPLRPGPAEAEAPGRQLERANGHQLGAHIYESLAFVLGRPDVHEAIAKALCQHNGGDWAQATEGGRQAFREEADRLIAEAMAAPR